MVREPNQHDIPSLTLRKWQHMVNKTTKKNKQKHTTIYVGHHYTQTNTNNVNKIGALLQTTGGKNEPNKLYQSTSSDIDQLLVR
jgi:hypothetical protein